MFHSTCTEILWRLTVITYQKKGSRISRGVYQVEGFVGRFHFPTYSIVDSKGDTIFNTRSLFPKNHPGQYYQTRTYKQHVIFHGVISDSYRNVNKEYNALRYQDATQGTPVTTLRDSVENEGQRIMTYLTKKTENILKYHGFDQEGLKKHSSNPWAPNQKESTFIPDSIVGKTVNIPKEVQLSAKQNPLRYEKKEKTVNISIDAVVSKKQKKQREQGFIPGEDETKQVNTKTATIEFNEQKYRFVARNYPEMMRCCATTISTY